MSEIKRVKIQNFIDTQIPEFLNEDNPLFKEFLTQYYISLEHQTGAVDLANNFSNYKKIENFNDETFYSENFPCILEEDLQILGTTIVSNHTIGFPSKYGLLKIGNEIITYTSKTDTTFEGCIRGFSAINEISDKTHFTDVKFSTSSSEFHSKGESIFNLNLLFFRELFRKFKYQFLPGFENRNFTEGINLQNILFKAKDFYTTKGTDTSYKLLFKILYNEDIEVIKPQEYMLRPSDNKYFVTKNILVEKISGNLDPLQLKGETLYQETSDGTASASIFNVELRPLNNKFLYEISLDPDTILLNFISTRKTNSLEDIDPLESILTVDSTVGFPNSGSLLVQSVNAPSAYIITYQDKTINQFLNLSGNNLKISKNDILIENNFSYVSKSGEYAYFRIINVIESLDYSETSNLRVGDVINLSSFGLELNDSPQYSSWIYNIPTSHNIKLVSPTASQNIWRIELFDSVKFTVGEDLIFKNTNDPEDLDYIATIRKIISNNIIEVNGDEILLSKNLLTKTLQKADVFNYPSVSNLSVNIQNSYIDNLNEYFYVASSGLPDYRIFADNRNIIISTQSNPDPFSGIGGTTTLNSNKKHRFYTGEKIYYIPQNNSGLATGTYFVSTLGNFNDSTSLSLSYSNSDLFSKKYIEVPYDSIGTIVKLDYENRDLEHQKILRKFKLNKDNSISKDNNSTSTNNKPIGMLVNGVELYSSTLYDENIYYGKLNDILITNSGNNYDIVNCPELEISDVVNDVTYGYGAKAYINLIGSVKGIKIVNPGSGYDKNIKVSIFGGNGNGASLEANVIKTRVVSGFRGDGNGVNPTDNSIRFVFPHNFEDGEVVEYFSNGNIEIEYFDPVSQEIRKLPSNSFYFAGVLSDTIIRLYRTKDEAAKKINAINLTTSPSFGFHYFRSLESKYSLSNVYVKDEGFGYSNKKVIIESQSDNIRRQNGINVVDNFIFAKNHNFSDKDLIVYNTTGSPISGISTENKYFVHVLDNDRFALSYAGQGRNISEDNFNKKKYIRLNSVGTGTHTFAFPPIELEIQANPESANGKLTLPILEPIVLGSIDSVFIESTGENYGTNDIINFHRRPNVSIKSITSECILKPIIIDGSIVEVQILNYGKGYNKDIDLIITGKGNFADLYPVVTNGRITSIIVLNGGIGYDETTKIRVEKRGTDAKFLANVFEWKINQVKKNESILNGPDEGILVPSKNQQNGLQFIHFYPPRELRRKLQDNLDNQNKEELSPNLSPILGWSYDGFPIYGPYNQVNNEIKLIRSSYRKQIERNQKIRPSGNNFPDGFFIQDYIFDIEYGDGLDEHNGTYIKNEDFPDGTYAYFFTIDIDNRGFSIPEYPYVLSTNFNRPPELENFNPLFNQNLDLGKLNLIRNVSPYYLNSKSSYYDLIDDVDSKYKQEFNIRSISNSGITSVEVYFPGDNYKVGDLLKFDNNNSGGYGANAVVSEIKGKPITSFNVGIVTISSVYFSKVGGTVTGISDDPIQILDGEYLKIKNIDYVDELNSSANFNNLKYKFIEGTRKVSIINKTVGISTDILDFNDTGNITKIYPNDISNFSINDYIQVDYEIFKILNILPQKSEFTVERLSNPGFHTAINSKLTLLPRKFQFFDNSSNIPILENKIVYFNPEEVVSTGENSTQYNISGISSIVIPARSIYIPNHSFTTGQPLLYNSGVDGIPLNVYNFPGDSNFELVDNQIVYAVNNGRDFLGISTLGFTTSVGIGTNNSSLYFTSGISGVGVAHSFTTNYGKVFGNVEHYYIDISTLTPHGLKTSDTISLNIIPQESTTIKFRYDSVLRKITTELIDFNSNDVNLTTSEVLIYNDNLKTGDKVVYYSNDNSPISGLIDNETYFIILDNPGKVKFSRYYSDAIEGIHIELDSIGSGTHSIAKINPKLEVIRGNDVIFDTSDESLSGLTLRLYRDSNFNIQLESYNYISNTNQRYLKTSSIDYPRELYYSFCSFSIPICPDFEVLDNNFIEIVGSRYNNEYEIVGEVQENSFRINLDSRPESLNYTKENLKSIVYNSSSPDIIGPINKVRLNSGGKTYKKLPKIANIISNLGENATVKARSNKIGKISSIDRVKDGFDYPTDTTLLPLLSVPAVVQVEDISRVDYIGIVTGGKNYNTAPFLKVIGNDRIKLQSSIQGSSVVDVKIIENTDDLSGPLRVIPIRNSNGYSIDDIVVNGNTVTLELLNSDNQIYPLVNSGYGSTEFVYPFEIGDEIFIERCRISEDFIEQSETSLKKDNFNSSNYQYRFFTVTGVSTENYTVTYSMSGVKDNLDLGEYTSDFGYGYVVNRKDMAEFEMFVVNDLSYFSEEVVFGYDKDGTNTFTAKVMKDGWDNDINELRLIEARGDLNVGDKLQGQISRLNGTVTNVNKFNLKTKLGVVRDKLNDLGDRVGFTNDAYQRISDNNYYQKFSYSIRGNIPYNVWKDSVKSLVHPAGFKEFSDLSINSFSTSTMKVGTASSLDLLVNIDNVQSTYTRNNFGMVTEDEQFEDGSIERIIFEEGVTLRPYILSKSNKVALIDDISDQFNGTAILEIISNKDVTFISTDIYRLGVSTEGLSIGDKIGFSTYHFYPDSTFIYELGKDFIQLSSDTPHKLFSNNGVSTSVTQNLNFYRRIPGCKVIGNTTFNLTSNSYPLFYREFDASNGITTTINLENDTFIIENHNFQTGQKLKYSPEIQPIVAIANTNIGSGAIFKPIFNEYYSVEKIKVIDGGSGYSSTNPPKITILGTESPLENGLFTALVETGTGIITSVSIGSSGLGYFPISTGTIGIGTTSEVEGRKDILIEVGGGIGGAIYERGYNVAITTSVSGISSNIVPNFSGQQNRFWGFFDPYIPSNSTSGDGIDAKFSVFIVYSSTTGQPISTSIVLRDGGRGYSVGDTVSLAGTFMGGSSPENDLSFVVSKVSSTRIALEANSEYFNIPGITTVGYGTGAKFNIERDDLGDISKVRVITGGKNYSLTDNITIAGTYIGGITPEDNLFLSPVVLGVDKLPKDLYVQKITNTSFQVAGTPTGNILNLNSLGVGTHSLEVIDQNSNSIISIDNVVQTPIYRKTLTLALSEKIKYDDEVIYLQNDANQLMLNDILNINEEFIRIKNIGIYGENSLIVERGILGTEVDVHDVTDPVYVVSGNYNIVKDIIYFSSPPYGPSGLPGLEVNSSFSGRAFSRRADPYYINDENIIFDDISDQFTGIAATEFTLKSNGDVVVGIFTDTNSITGSSAGVDINNNPIILINNIPQIGGLDYVIDTPGQNTIKFISGVPVAGKITVVGVNTGFGYLPLVGASASVSVSATGQISNIKLTGYGKGYRQPPSISVISNVGSGASISATVGSSGTITSLTIVNSGSGYTSTSIPEIRIDPPQNYSNLDLVYANGYSGEGQGAKGSVIVGNGSSIISFNLDDAGISYKAGDVLVASGIMTDPKATKFEEFRIEVKEIFTDSFSGWYPGQFIQFDGISEFFNGIKRKFTLTVTISGKKEVLSLKTYNPQDISITNNLFVFINDILQVPNESYTFTGSRIVFKEAPKKGSKCNILFFRGSDLDVEQVDPPRTIKEGDEVQIDENINDPFDWPQFNRVVKNIVATDILDTFPYDSIGISTNPIKIRPLHWTKQTYDRIINGVLYSKSRPDLKSKITPTAIVIKDINKTDTSIYVDSAIPLFEDIDENRAFSEDLRDIIIVNNREIIDPILKSNISYGSTISSIDILNPGSGYINKRNPLVSISKKYLSKKDPIYNWSNNVGFITNFSFNSIGYNTAFISVGSSGYYSFSLGGETWSSPEQIIDEYDFSSVTGYDNVYVAVGQTASAYKSIGITTGSNWEKLQLLTVSQDILGRFSISASDYDGDFKKVIFNPEKNTLLISGDRGRIFNGVGINTDKIYENQVGFSNINSIAFNSSIFVAVGNVGDILYSQTGINWEINRTKSTLQNLNDIVWDGSQFVIVGNNGTILTSNDGIVWNNISKIQFNKNIIKIRYTNNLYTILDSQGKLYFSLNLLDWVIREVDDNFKLNELSVIGTNDNDIKYISVGSSGFISYSTPVLNEAIAISTTIGGKLDKITIINGGFGYSIDNNTPIIVETDTCEKEQIYSIKAKGDFGTITNLTVYDSGNLGFGTTSPAIVFELKSENYGTNILPNMQYTPLTSGDYFVINDSNVICGHALTGITTSLGGMSNYPNSIVGTATTFINGVYKVESATPSSLGITTVRCIFAPVPAIGADKIFINTGINTTGFYGSYSFGIIYDYQNRARENPKSFITNKTNGLVGLSSTGPLIYRTRSVN